MNSISKSLFGGAMIGLAASSVLAGPPGEWYNGQPDLVNGYSSESDTFQSGFISMVYEDFNHVSGNVTDVWGNFFLSANPQTAQGANWEIWDAAPGNGGNLVANGFSSVASGDVTITPNGFDNFGLLGYHMDVDGLNVALTPNTQYWVGLSFVGDNTGGQAYLQTTSGASPIGSPINNNNGIQNAPIFGNNFFNTGTNFSLGVNAIPGPASAALLGLGGLVATRRRRA